MSKKFASTFNCLRFFALNKEGTVEDVAAFIKKDYTTALRIIRKLVNADIIKLERLERTSARGKEKRIYGIMLHGLFLFVINDRETATSKFEEIAEAHSDKLLTFKNWEYFKRKGLENLIRENFFNSLKIWFWGRMSDFYFLSLIMGIASLPKPYIYENLGKGVDADILGITLMMDPPEHIRQVEGEQKWSRLLKLFEAVEENYELRMFKEEVLFQLERKHKEALKALNQWRNFKF